MKIIKSLSVLALGLVISLGMAYAQEMMDEDFISEMENQDMPKVEMMIPVIADAIAVGEEVEGIAELVPMHRQMMQRQDFEMPMNQQYMMRGNWMPLMNYGMRMTYDNYNDGRYDQGRRYKKSYDRNDYYDYYYDYDGKNIVAILFFKLLCVIGTFIFLFLAAGVVRKGWEWGGHCCHVKGGFFNKEK